MTRTKQNWDSIVSEYPDRWVILDDVSWDHGLVLNAIVIDSCDDDSMEETLLDYLRQGKDYAHVRTCEKDSHVNTLGFFHE